MLVCGDLDDIRQVGGAERARRLLAESSSG
jgi:hypothetical protein